MSRLMILDCRPVVVPAAASTQKLPVTPGQFSRQCWLLKRLGLRGVSLSEGPQALQLGDSHRCAVLRFALKVAAPYVAIGQRQLV